METSRVGVRFGAKTNRGATKAAGAKDPMKRVATITVAAMLVAGSIVAQDAPKARSGSNLTPAADVAGTGTANQIPKWTDGAGTLANSSLFDDGFNLGIGTTSPGGVFDVRRSSSSDLLMRVWNGGTGGSKLRYVSDTSAVAQLQFTDTFEWLAAIANNGTTGLQFRVTSTGNGVSEAALNASTRMTITRTGRVGIGTTSPSSTLHVAGDVTVDGNIAAKYQDVAEWVPVTSKVEPGTVVVLNPARTNEVMRSEKAYDTRVAGVVSDQPGVILGEASDSKAKVATTGRVRVHVDASRGAVGIGDLLVTGVKPGTAMKSEEVDLGGIKIHRPGTIIGKALEPLQNGEGDILVLLSMQ